MTILLGSSLYVTIPSASSFFMTNYIIKPLGEMYMEEVTADDIRLALVPLSKKSEGLYNKVNMLLKCIFYAAERNQILEHKGDISLRSLGFQFIRNHRSVMFGVPCPSYRQIWSICIQIY